MLLYFGSNLTPHEKHQYLPKLRDYLLPYILTQKKHALNIEALFKHEFTRNDVIKSCEYYVLNNNNVRSKSAIDDFLIALNRLFEETLNEKYPNQNLKNIQPFSKLSHEIEKSLEIQGRFLQDRETNPPIEEDQFEHLCNILESTSEKNSSLQPKLIIKLILLYGFKFNRVSQFLIDDFDIEKRILKVKRNNSTQGEIKLELPYSLFLDFKKYYNHRIKNVTKNRNLFLTVNSTPVASSLITGLLDKARDSYYSKSQLEGLEGQSKNPFTATGLSKFAIINMILQGMSQAVILDVTGVNEVIYNSCQYNASNKLSEDYNRHINYKLRAIKTFDRV